MLDPRSFAPIPGARDRQLDALTAVRAAIQVTGPGRTARSIKPFFDEFFRWMRHSYSDTDRALRAQVLLAITADAEGTPEHEANKLVTLAQELRSHIGD